MIGKTKASASAESTKANSSTNASGQTNTNSTQNEQSTTSGTRTNGPWEPIIPYLTTLASQASAASQQPGYTAALPAVKANTEKTAAGGFLNPAANPTLAAYTQAAYRPLQDSFDQNLVKIGDAAQLAGAYGGDRQGVVNGTALKDLLNAQADASSKIYYNDYAAERANQNAAIDNVGKIQAAETGASFDGLNNLSQILQSLQGYGTSTATSESKGTTTLQQLIDEIRNASTKSSGSKVGASVENDIIW